MRSLIALLLTTVCVYGCTNKACDLEMPGPTVTYLDIRKDGKTVSAATLNKAQLYWIKEGTKQYENDISTAILDKPLFGSDNRQVTYGTKDGPRPVLYSATMANVSANQGIKDFYIEYTNGTIDSVFVDYRMTTTEEGHCSYSHITFNEIKFRGVAVPVDSSAPYHTPLIYIINK